MLAVRSRTSNNALIDRHARVFRNQECGGRLPPTIWHRRAVGRDRWGYSTTASGDLRGAAFLAHPNFLAILLASVVPLIVSWRFRGLRAPALVVLGLGLYSTNSRTGIILAVVALLVSIAFSASNTNAASAGKRLKSVILVAFCLVTLFGLNVGGQRDRVFQAILIELGIESNLYTGHPSMRSSHMSADNCSSHGSTSAWQSSIRHRNRPKYSSRECGTRYVRDIIRAGRHRWPIHLPSHGIVPGVLCLSPVGAVRDHGCGNHLGRHNGQLSRHAIPGSPNRFGRRDTGGSEGQTRTTWAGIEASSWLLDSVSQRWAGEVWMCNRCGREASISSSAMVGVPFVDELPN